VATKSDTKQLLHSEKQKAFGFSARDECTFALRYVRSSRTDTGERSRAPLPSVIGSVAPAHGFTHAVSPTACGFLLPTSDRSTTTVDSVDG